jgi:hypothetical protein
MEKAVVIQTPIGRFNGNRDGIIIKNIEWKPPQAVFCCNISKSGLLDGNEDSADCYDFKIRFRQVVSLFHAEYDTYEAIAKGFPKAGDSAGAFERIENSRYIKELPIRSEYANKVKHYCLSTYDDVFDILAEDFTIELL